ncbi:hypothetical protein MW887_010394 [Aspergillus wentii]|nr:hypothetical protein MW887_010394 [Aspergillus wentii]
MRVMRSLLKDRLRPDASSPESSKSEREDSQDLDAGMEPVENPLSIPEAPSSTVSSSARHIDTSPGIPASGPNLDRAGSLPDPSYFSPGPSTMSRTDDVIDQGLIGMEFADELVEIFIHDLAPFFPVVVLHPRTTAVNLRRSRPVLFLSIIAAAAIAVDSAVAAELNREMVRLYADRFFVQGDKSLELTQALLIMIIFYYPPDSPLKLQVYQYTHIAATMALEIGLASKRKVSKKPTGNDDDNGPFDEHMAEQARAILGCYHLASVVAIKTRRPNMLMFNDWMRECVKHLERSPIPVDRHMAAWFELQKITDEAMASFGLDDTSSTAPLTESRVQAVLRWFDNRMQSWKNNIPTEMFNVPLTLDYHHTNLSIYELAVGEGYRDPDAITKQHYTLPSLEEDSNDQPPDSPLSAIRVDITMKWLNAAHEMLDFFLSCDTDTMRKMSNLIYTRVGVAFMSLLKIYFSVRTGLMGDFIMPQDVNVEVYLDGLTRRLREAGDGLKYRIPSRWYYVFAVKGRNWYEKFEKRQSEKEAGMVPPMESSSSTTQSSTPGPFQPQFGSVDQSQMGSYNMGLGISQTPAFSHMGSSYSVPTGMNTQWSSDQGNHLLGLNQFAGYTPSPTVPSHFVYEAPQKYPDERQPGNFYPAGTGLELDGWLPEGGLYGAPRLPEF